MQQYFTSFIVPIAFFLDVYCLSFENHTIFCQKKKTLLFNILKCLESHLMIKMAAPLRPFFEIF